MEKLVKSNENSFFEITANQTSYKIHAYGIDKIPEDYFKNLKKSAANDTEIIKLKWREGDLSLKKLFEEKLIPNFDDFEKILTNLTVEGHQVEFKRN